ncbi:hypothetical protein PInf_022768 [Phytophthora infestans]|nr:hypothetical protein PInf_022768 [Phytophthora infestans]
MVLIIHPRYRQVSPPVAFKTAISANKSTAKQWGFEVGNLRPSNEDPRLGTSEKPKRSGSASPGAVGSGTTPAVNARSACGLEEATSGLAVSDGTLEVRDDLQNALEGIETSAFVQFGHASDEPVKAGADLRSLKDWITIIEVQCERTVPLEFLDLEFTRFVNAVDKLKATKEASQALEPQLADIQRHHDYSRSHLWEIEDNRGAFEDPDPNTSSLGFCESGSQYQQSGILWICGHWVQGQGLGHSKEDEQTDGDDGSPKGPEDSRVADEGLEEDTRRALTRLR